MRRIWLFTLICGGCTGAVLGPEDVASAPAERVPDGELGPDTPVTIPDVSECEGQPARAGEAPLRRLTRIEYNNTVRDLLGVTSEPASDFPGDEVSAGFDHNSRTAVAELTVEKYQRAAEQLAARCGRRSRLAHVLRPLVRTGVCRGIRPLVRIARLSSAT